MTWLEGCLFVHRHAFLAGAVTLAVVISEAESGATGSYDLAGSLISIQEETRAFGRGTGRSRSMLPLAAEE